MTTSHATRAMLDDRSGLLAGPRLRLLRVRARRLRGRPLEAFQPPEARRHLLSVEEPPAHLAVEESIPGRPLSPVARLGEGAVHAPADAWSPLAARMSLDRWPGFRGLRWTGGRRPGLRRSQLASQTAGSLVISSITGGSSPFATSASVTDSSTARRFARTATQSFPSGSA